MCTGKHKCLVCKKIRDCDIQGKHGAMSYENCMGDYDDLCDNCPIEEHERKLRELNLI